MKLILECNYNRRKIVNGQRRMKIQMFTNTILKTNNLEDDRFPKGNLGKIFDEASDFVKGMRT